MTVKPGAEPILGIVNVDDSQVFESDGFVKSRQGFIDRFFDMQIVACCIRVAIVGNYERCSKGLTFSLEVVNCSSEMFNLNFSYGHIEAFLVSKGPAGGSRWK